MDFTLSISTRTEPIANIGVVPDRSTASTMPTSSVLTVIGVLISDIALAMLDPRIRLQGAATK